jgi:hypothetical protein
MARVCFQDNVVGVSNVVVFGNTFTSDGVNNDNSTGPLCGHAAFFKTLQQFNAFAPLYLAALAPTKQEYTVHN